MSDTPATLLWLRRDLRLADHPALDAAIARGGPVIAVFVRDAEVDVLGAAPAMRLGQSLNALARDMADIGGRLILRAGPAREVLEALVDETGADAVLWSRLYDPGARERDARVEEALVDRGIEARGIDGHLMFEPWDVETGGGGFYRVYTPYWRNVSEREVDTPLAAPSRWPAPEQWPDSETLEAWDLGAGMRRGHDIVAGYARPGEAQARARLDEFIASDVADYDTGRNMVAEQGTSKLSEHLALGEISPRTCWHAGRRAEAAGKEGATTFLKELVWREFAYHLMWHTPRLVSDNWRPEWDGFPWKTDERLAEVRRWKQGRTGIPFVDAAMREMYVTGTMHNRARMIVASYLTKHCLVHWRVGQQWFEDCLIDWDPASNALGWQWVAGSGPDATPYFRVFNPETQAKKFDPEGAYRNAWIAEGQTDPPETALQYFEAVPRRWGLSAGDSYPDPVVPLGQGRETALEAYKNREF